MSRLLVKEAEMINIVGEACHTCLFLASSERKELVYTA